MISRRAALGGLVAAFAFSAFASPAFAADAIRIGTQKGGTVAWELDVIKTHGLDAKHGFELKVVDLANNDSAKIAFNAGEIDMFVTDWLFVSRERADGDMITYAPFSSSVGSLVVKGDGPIRTLTDLKDRKIGIAGGAIDKNWLLVQAYAKKALGLDLAGAVTPTFGAPPLLNEKFSSGELDAVLTNWNFAARLTPKGARELLTVQQAQEGLGVPGVISNIGYVFKDEFARAHMEAVMGFLAASKEAKEILKTSDAEWDRLRPMMKLDDDGVFRATRDRFRAGIPARPVADEARSAAELYEILAKIGGPKLVGASPRLVAGTYWSGM